MEKADVILIAGIIIALIWLGFFVMLEGKKRFYVGWIGVAIDVVLFLFCRNTQLLCLSVIGGALMGLIPGLGGSVWKYERAVRQMNGIKNWVVALMIFFVMIFMSIAIAYPGLRIEF